MTPLTDALMRYLKAALFAFATGVAMTALFITVEMVAANRAQLGDCLKAVVKTGGAGCDGYVQFGGPALLVPFAVSFVVMFPVSLRRQRQLVP